MIKISENLDLNNLDGEIWKYILDYEGNYQVSNLGRVKSFKKYLGTNERILKQNKNSSGYFHINLSKNGKEKNKSIHRLMYESFIGVIPDGYDVHHIDENKENNDFNNFELMPESEHMKLHMNNENNHNIGIIRTKETIIKMSEKKKGKYNPMFGKHHSEETIIKMSENNFNRKLSNQDIYDIRKSLELKLYTPKQLSWMFDVSIATISLIKNNKIWKI